MSGARIDFGSRPDETEAARDRRLLAEARAIARAEFKFASPYRVGRRLGESGGEVASPYAIGSRAWRCFRAGIRDGYEIWKKSMAPDLSRVWFRFDPANGDGQPLPTERRYVLVQIAPRPDLGLPPAVAVGYLRFAAGDRGSPQFIVPGVGGTALAWCDCLGDNFRPPLWRDRGPQPGTDPPTTTETPT